MSEFVMREEFVKRTTEKSMFNEIKRLVMSKTYQLISILNAYLVLGKLCKGCSSK